MAAELIPRITRVICKKGSQNGRETLKQDELGTFYDGDYGATIHGILLDKDIDPDWELNNHCLYPGILSFLLSK
jgi:hypothetical protein